ncbi:MAG: grasp-with-spasm system SPASM domain peptide maturase [Bacteroidota bacterium]
MNTHFILFSNCLLVKGDQRSTICDIQRNDFALIPNEMYEVLLFLENHSINETIKHYGEDNKEIIEEYLDYIEENEYGFYCSELEKSNFPKIDTIFKSYHKISNFILELREVDREYLTPIFNQLHELECHSLHILLHTDLQIEDIQIINTLSRNSSLRSIEITTRYYSNIEEFLPLINKTPNKIVQFILFDCEKDSILEYGEPFLFKVIKTKKPIIDCRSCGNISLDYMVVNKDKVFESLSYNSCLNKKMGIDFDGNIKNCPSMQTDYGNINNTSLSEVLKNEKFTKLWTIKKDEIKVCQDCEFRHVCTDCRAYIEDPNDIFSKPLKCGYDPYTNEWSDWSQNPLKQTAITEYKLF